MACFFFFRFGWLEVGSFECSDWFGFELWCWPNISISTWCLSHVLTLKKNWTTNQRNYQTFSTKLSEFFAVVFHLRNSWALGDDTGWSWKRFVIGSTWWPYHGTMATDSHQPGRWVGGLKDVSYLCLSHDFALAFFGVTGGAGACRGWVMMHFSCQQGKLEEEKPTSRIQEITVGWVEVWLPLVPSIRQFLKQENYQKVAEESDVQKMLEILQGLLGEGLRQASQDARIAASSFVDRRKGQFLSCRSCCHNVSNSLKNPIVLQVSSGRVWFGFATGILRYWYVWFGANMCQYKMYTEGGGMMIYRFVL